MTNFFSHRDIATRGAISPIQLNPILKDSNHLRTKFEYKYNKMLRLNLQ